MLYSTMPSWEDNGIILSLRPHGENGGVVTLLTKAHGRAAGYVYGISSPRVRGMLEIGNVVSARWQAKSHDQLGTYTLELETSHAADVLDDPVKLTALQSACAVADKTLPEHESHPGVYEGLKALMSAFSTPLWAASYIYWEIGLLRELGFGLDLTRCAATGAADNLIYVSPKSGCAVSGPAGEEYKDRLLHLPPFLRGEARFEDEDILNGLKLTGHFLLHRVFSQANTNLPEPRLRLEEKYGKLAK
ncbi:MAG: DNA repair protein RecO [Alphaproteobacteria bacterium]